VQEASSPRWFGASRVAGCLLRMFDCLRGDLLQVGVRWPGMCVHVFFVCVHVCVAPDESARTHATRGVLLFVVCDVGLQGVVHVPCLCLLFLP
jgi:hypothetical protein